MKKIILLMLAAVCLTSCWTSIFTVAPTDAVVVPVKTVYTTTVTTPTPKHTTVTTVTVTNFNTDLSFYLDLNAVAAAFAESRNVAEFEQLLNSSRYMINNLDLNRDGWIDYLRVIETHRGVYHTFLIQACLGHSLYQDVATLVAEHRPNALYVEVIGDRWLYGPNYIVRPVFIKRPPLWDVFGRPTYAAWTSPYYYGYWPSYYQKPKPIYLNHYQAYVRTYMSNHHYCHQCDYPKQFFYSGYAQMTQPHAHNDYATQHPSDAFEQRVTHTLTANGSGVTVRNAGQLREETARQTSKSETTTSKPATSTTTSSSSSTARTSSSTTTTTRTSSGSATTRTSGTSTANRTSSSSTATTRQPSTSVESRVNKSGTTRTTVRTTDETGRTTTVKRESINNARTAAPAIGHGATTTSYPSESSIPTRTRSRMSRWLTSRNMWMMPLQCCTETASKTLRRATEPGSTWIRSSTTG